MKDAFAVGRVQRVRQLYAQRHHFLGRNGSARNPVRKRHASEKLHGNERPPLIFIHLVDRAYVGMIQSRRRTSFAPKACVLGRIDHAHSTGAKFLQDAVVRYGLANHWRESYV